MFVRVQVPPRVLKKIVIDYLIVCYGFFITYLATNCFKSLKRLNQGLIMHLTHYDLFDL